MCGIAGALFPEDRPVDFLARLGTAMAGDLAHRGPDDEGVWMQPQAGLVLAHRRLAILDLSPAGHQPMHSADGRLHIVFNGEIYNFGELRAELEAAGHRFRGHADTEVLLEAIAAWGVERALARASGMFALAVWDRRARTLHLARDRLGEKPLYYGTIGGVFAFASGIAPLRRLPGWERKVDRNALAALLRYGYIPGPLSIQSGVRKLPPGTILSLTPDASADTAVPRPYWTPVPKSEPYTEHEAVDELETLLHRAVARQMVADVPVGAFLSGGIDSTTVTALMQEHSSTPVRTFTIGFDQTQYDEAEHAAAVARHLGTDHTTIQLSGTDARTLVPALAGIYDEPFANPSQIPAVLVSRLARDQVTVCLSGDGGDELFGGYGRYRWAERLDAQRRRLPAWLRRALTMPLSAPPDTFWNTGQQVLRGLSRHGAPAVQLGARVRKLAAALPAVDAVALYDRLLSYGDDVTALVPGATALAPLPQLPEHPLATRMRLWDLGRYLPDDSLAKVDRAAMSVALETRLPLLDHHIVEFALRLTPQMLRHDGRGKWPLRQVLYRRVPRTLIERPKMGFSVPISTWLRGPLRDWAEASLDTARLRNDGYFDDAALRQLWYEHRRGRRDHGALLWGVLMFHEWLAHGGTAAGAADARPPHVVTSPVK